VANVVVIEDDRAIALGLRLNLRKEGHEVALSQDGEQGLALALDPGVDLVVLDVMLPGRNGYELLKELRHRGSQAAVLMLTAKGLEGDKILGLKLGADDYMAKPFGLGELLARVEALLRRRPPKPKDGHERVEFGDVVVDLAAQTVLRGGQPIEVTPQEFRVPSRATTSWRAAGARSTRARRGPWTTSCARSGSSWSTTRRRRSTSSPSAGTATASSLRPRSSQ
jgi:DNA-binding response OmpR family regulator